MSADFELHEPERFTAGAVGEPGARTFYLQAVEGDALVSLRLEKEQVAALAEYLGGLLADLPTPSDLPDDLSLVEPVIPEWVVGSLAVAYNEAEDRILVVAEEFVPEPDEDDEPTEPVEPARARFHITREQVAAFVPYVHELVASGRPLCPICGRPI